MLGVMIQGATRKTTVSVKRDTSGRVWGKEEDSVALQGVPGHLPTRSLHSGPQVPQPHTTPQCCTHPHVHQADTEGDQPQEMGVREREPLHVESDHLLPRLPLYFIGQVIRPQHRFIVGQGVPT